MNKAISILGMPMWLGQARYGVNLGPAFLRAAGLAQVLGNLNLSVIDSGDIAAGCPEKNRQEDKDVKNLKAVAAACQRLATEVGTVAATGNFPLVLGGDHSIAIGSLAGLASHYNNLGVIWFDAHADINTPETTGTGNIHGMPVAASLGLGHPALTGVWAALPVK